MIRVMVADDHPVVRQGLIQIIGTTTDIVVAGEASNGNEALDKVAENDYDLILLDISMPGMSTKDVIKELRSLRPNLPILVLTIHPEEQFAAPMLKYGASGYLTKDRSPIELIEAIRRVSTGHKYISPDLIGKIAHYLNLDTHKLPHEALSHREYEIMILISSGKTIKEIAGELCISIKTVSTHRTNILMKMKMTKNIELTHYALVNGLISW